MVVEWDGWDDKKRERGGRLNDSEGSWIFRFLPSVSREISQ